MKYSRSKIKNKKPLAVDVLFKAYPVVPLKRFFITGTEMMTAEDGVASRITIIGYRPQDRIHAMKRLPCSVRCVTLVTLYT